MRASVAGPAAQPPSRSWLRRVLAAAAFAFSHALALAAPLAGHSASAEDLLRAPHRAEDGFFNPWERNPRSAWNLIKWIVFSRNPYDKSGPIHVPSVQNDGAYLRAPAARQLGASITWVGHATFAVQDRGQVFLTDPHFTKRALLPARKQPPGIPLAAVPPDAFAVVSHSHYDHLDAETVEALPASVGWYVPLGLAGWFRERGRNDVVELDWWQSARRGDYTITCLPTQHWSRRIEHATNETLWCAWLIDSGERRYFFAGDTGYFEGFAAFAREFSPIDAALLPIGAYEPRWFMAYQHMDPAQAYQAFLDLGAHHMFPMHWGTFDLTDEPVDLAPRELADVIRARAGADARVHVLAIGERWRFPTPDAEGTASQLGDSTRSRTQADSRP